MSTDNLTARPATSDSPGPSGPSEPVGPPPASAVANVIRYVMPVVVMIGGFAILTKHAKDPLSNTDTYFHLRFGHEFLSGAWSLRDPGSVTTFGTNDWVPTQWLPQVVMAQTEDWFGLAGVAWLAGLIYIALALTLWATARQWASPLVAAPVTVVALLAASPGLSMRPQVLSYLLVAVTTSAWMATRADRRVRWWLVPLTWVWAMVHGMWPLGIVIGLVALVGLALDRAVPRRRWWQLATIPVLSLVAAGLTPVGPRLYSAVLEVNSRGHYFAEWQPPDFTDANSIALLVLAGVLLLRLMRRPEGTTWTDAALLLLAGGWALYSERTVMVAAVMLVPMTAVALQGALGERAPLTRREVGAILTGAAACLVVLALLVPHTADEPPPQPGWYDALDELPAGTPVINDWGEGGYLMWRFPDLDLVMNGYGDIFTDTELDRNFRMDATNRGWLADVKATGAHYALLRPYSSLAYSLDVLEGWTVRYHSAEIELLEAPDDWPRSATD